MIIRSPECNGLPAQIASPGQVPSPFVSFSYPDLLLSCSPWHGYLHLDPNPSRNHVGTDQGKSWIWRMLDRVLLDRVERLA